MILLYVDMKLLYVKLSRLRRIPTRDNDDGGGCRVRLCEPPQTLSQFVIRCVFGRSINVGDCHLEERN